MGQERLPRYLHGMLSISIRDLGMNTWDSEGDEDEEGLSKCLFMYNVMVYYRVKHVARKPVFCFCSFRLRSMREYRILVPYSSEIGSQMNM